MSFTDITNADIQALVKSGIRLWVVDKLPPNTDDKQELLVATVDKGDRLHEVLAKWLEQAGIKPHRERSKREAQLVKLMRDNAIPKDKLVLTLKNAEHLHKPNYTEWHLLTEQCECKLIIQGDILRIGADIANSDRFMHRACVGVHALTGFN